MDMKSGRDQLIQEIANSALFRQLKDIVENMPGWHEREDVYSHSVQTAKTARELIVGKFINNKKAQAFYEQFMNKAVSYTHLTLPTT